ncbi:MAG: DUF2946 family protein [Azoarcus sp.]|jgi:hypothetical protein|nr:DUF2946 family protein [Azoarcus sp.]
MRPAPPLDTILAPAFRKRRCRFAWLAVLAVCLQLLASGLASIHAVEAFNAGNNFFAAEICHGTADGSTPDGGEHPSAGGGHCPFCRLAQAGIAPPPSPTALAFSPPEPATLFLPAANADLQPSAPYSPHALTRAPPFSFA